MITPQSNFAAWWVLIDDSPTHIQPTCLCVNIYMAYTTFKLFDYLIFIQWSHDLKYQTLQSKLHITDNSCKINQSC